MQASETTQLVKTLAVQSDSLSLSPQSPHGRRELASASCPLTSTLIPCHRCASLPNKQTINGILKTK